MTCPKCARSVPDDAKYCPYCGYTIVRQAPRPRQRGNGMGSAYRRGRSWTAVVTLSWALSPEGKVIWKRHTKGGFRTKNDALAYCVTAKTALTAKPEAPTLDHYWQLYESGEYKALSKSKQMAYDIAWKKLAPIAHRKIDTLTVQDLRQVVSSAAKTYYPARDMKTVLTHLFRLAGADQYVSKDLPEYILLPELHEKERTPFSDVEQAALWKLYESGDRRAAIPLIMIYTGMMPGEIQRLKVDMIDFDAHRITGAGIKTAVRKESPIYLPDIIVPVLYEEVQSGGGSDGYVWIRNEDLFYANYYAALAAAGCRRLEPYCCRHTTATALAISEGIAPQTIQKVMRWSSTKMLDRYAHPDDAAAAAAVNTLTR